MHHSGVLRLDLPNFPENGNVGKWKNGWIFRKMENDKSSYNT